jgi:D-alanyl-D-alanine carboxypeptidase (penicillin-binding protein 5/6)
MLAVVLGANSDLGRATEAKKLLDYGFAAFDTVAPFAPGSAIATLQVYKGAAKELSAGLAAPVWLTLPHGAAPRIRTTLSAVDPLVAPVEKGATVATMAVTLDGQPVATLALAAQEQVAPGNIFNRAADTVRLWFH